MSVRSLKSSHNIEYGILPGYLSTRHAVWNWFPFNIGGVLTFLFDGAKSESDVRFVICYHEVVIFSPDQTLRAAAGAEPVLWSPVESIEIL
ncbi:hypothetical protein Ddc_20509 [Ditylenchus destructor]|nr:hypothetical protein Ddc_20509 [Ditylenchus destructor]